MSYRNGTGRAQNDRSQKKNAGDDDLLVFGYSCRLFPVDSRAAEIAADRHLQTWDADPDKPTLDRFDVRLLLGSMKDVEVPKKNQGDEEDICPTEQMEEEMCDEERYKDLQSAVERDQEEERQRQLEESKRKKKAEFHFSYDEKPGTSSSGNNLQEGDSDSEDEPFQPPPGIKFPVGLALPETQKHNHIIERTALFVVEKGPQMEIVIKAKQRNNANQFGFLEFDNILYPYYKYIQKLIREKKYTPSLSKKTTASGSAVENSKSSKHASQKVATSNALAAIANMGSDSENNDSDSDCELHPSLLAASSGRKSPDIAEGGVGPKRKPPSPKRNEAHHKTLPKVNYDMSKSNDVYAALFKNLSGVNQAKELEKKIEEQRSTGEVDEEWREWWHAFYDELCPHIRPAPLYPPPPDLEPIVQKYAEHVAERGAATELALRNRADLKLDFMKPESPFFSYYQHRVRMHQWHMHQEAEHQNFQQLHFAAMNDRPAPMRYGSPTGMLMHPNPMQSATMPIPVSASRSSESQERFSNSPIPNEEFSANSPQQANLNRKQRRRRLQEAFQVQEVGQIQTAPPPGVVDPLTLKLERNNEENLHKSQSSPALLNISTENKPSPTSISFSLRQQKEDEGQKWMKHEIFNDISATNDDFEEFGIDFGEEDGKLKSGKEQAEMTPPPPPTIPNNTQLDRKEKARIFMEKLLNEKKMKKQREEDELRQMEMLAREEERRKLEKERERLRKEEMRKTAAESLEPGQALNEIDRMINMRIDNLLQSTMLGAHVERPDEKKKEDEQRDRDRSRDREKKKKKKEKHRKRKGDRRRR
ncbi:hypothetical protein WR25_01890 [Diploscapter pachys]|uniref:SURP motif domain-containing protein n=1 Tax=Diploscapter pachys TaxID=2018661 RepID=A0A2A2LAE7_9BILA|nr:hypothetical protein WR25_01890 [Diploscapter pachys]